MGFTSSTHRLLAVGTSALAPVAALAGKPPSGSSTGVGTLVLPNPVADLQNQSLTDQKGRRLPSPT